MPPRSGLVFLEDYREGMCFESRSYRITEEELVTFAKQWDPQPFHTDKAAAARTMYGGLIACSSHIFSIFCHLGNLLEPKAAALAGLGFDALRMLQPVRPGDSLHMWSQVLEVHRSSSKPDRGTVRSEIRLLNQDDAVVFTLTSTFMVASRSLAEQFTD